MSYASVGSFGQNASPPPKPELNVAQILGVTIALGIMAVVLDKLIPGARPTPRR